MKRLLKNLGQIQCSVILET